ncbi:MAG: hypothetical protein ACT4TC_11570 [Myxococcaceae bacterium]
MLLTRTALLALLLPAFSALAQRDTSREALLRFEETLTLRKEESNLAPKDLTPVIVISVTPAFEETKNWYPTAALASVVRVFGGASVRSCEACMAPRVFVEGGHVEQNTSALTVEEIVRLDENARGDAAPARTAIWLDETSQGVSLRMIDLKNSRIVTAENFDPALKEQERTRNAYSLTQELDRRARRDSLAHFLLDATVYPGQHVSLDWVEQWGDSNANLSGVTLSAIDPVLGIGATYYRVIPQALNIMVGAQVVMSLPTALVTAVSGQGQQVLDPLITAVAVVRVPLFRTNYALTFTASTNLKFGVGFSLLNFSLLPFLP